MLYHISKVFYWCWFKLIYRYEIIGKENEVFDDKLIIASNHLSNMDPPVIACALKQEIHFLGKSELFKNPIFSWYIRQHNTHPIKRGRGDSAAIRQCLQLIEGGHSLTVFPQGTRGGDWNEAADGVSFLAKKTGARVLPVRIYGSDDVLNVGQIVPRLFKKVKVVIGKPIAINQDETIQDFTKRISENINNL